MWFFLVTKFIWGKNVVPRFTILYNDVYFFFIPLPATSFNNATWPEHNTFSMLPFDPVYSNEKSMICLGSPLLSKQNRIINKIADVQWDYMINIKDISFNADKGIEEEPMQMCDV